MIDALWKKKSYKVADKTVPNTTENALLLLDLSFSHNTSFGELTDL
jgi:hypothetical protein